MIRIVRSTVALAILGLPGVSPADEPPEPRTVFLIGDSTVKNGSGNGAQKLWGWGNFLADHFDPAKARVQNRALGGRSSRTYLTEGLWDKVLTDLKPGDVVLIQFGHNDGGPIDTGRARASLKGVGQGVADDMGNWTATTTPLANGNYRLIAEAHVAKAYPNDQPPVPTAPLGSLVVAAARSSGPGR